MLPSSLLDRAVAAWDWLRARWRVAQEDAIRRRQPTRAELAELAQNVVPRAPVAARALTDEQLETVIRLLRLELQRRGLDNRKLRRLRAAVKEWNRRHGGLR